MPGHFLKYGFALGVLGLSGFFGTIRAADLNQGWIEVKSPHFHVSTNAGEKEGRRIADQFEQIRTMFHSEFSTLRVDPAQPILIIAAKNEGTMKVYLPEFWEVKGRVHPAGLYQQGEDKHYVIVQADAEGHNPYHTLYHEYTHALVHLNFGGLPVWLDEGLAEFFGNTTLGEKESQTGTIDPNEVHYLRETKLLPIETLLQVDHTSPHYNESKRVSVFYAESWALVHYLMMDPEARKQQLLSKFLQALGNSNNQIEAAQKTFGDLKKFGQVLEGYARQSTFQVGIVKMGQADASKSYAVRPISTAEVLAERGDFFAHKNQLEQALPLLQQAMQADAKLAAVHEALAYYYRRKREAKTGIAEAEEAIHLGDTSFIASYYRGVLLTETGSMSEETVTQAIQSLEHATQANPQFAAAFEALSRAYARFPDGMKKAIQAATTAVKLEPSMHNYTLNLCYLLLNNDQDADARYLANKLLTVANSPEETHRTQELLNRIREHEVYLAERKKWEANQGKTTSAAPSAATAGTKDVSSGDPIRVPLKNRTMAIDGTISEMDCSRQPEVIVTLNMTKGPMAFHAPNLGELPATTADGKVVTPLPACEQWEGKHVKIWFQLVQGKEYLGEMTKISFQ